MSIRHINTSAIAQHKLAEMDDRTNKNFIIRPNATSPTNISD